MPYKNNKAEKKILNCICEVNIDGKMALVSLYDDLPHFEYDLTIDNLKNSVIKLRSLVQELKQRIKKLENENTNFQTVNNVLSKNITSLYKTASIEIQRKDKMIDDLRKSQVVPSTSKMFSSTNNFQIEKTKVNTLSDSKKNIEQIENTIEKPKVLNPNNNDNITTIVIKPNHNIPKTIYYKRMCQKLVQQNDTIDSKKQMSQQIENTNTDDKITQDKNEELNKDENALKEMSTSLIHNESKDIINSTLVICESDITPSDCELDTTPVIHSDNQEKDKENVSIESFFSKLKQPAKFKKKLIISPATIGVQNTLNENFKGAKKINSLDSTTQCEITNSPEKQIIKSLNKDTLTTYSRNNFPEFDIKTEDKPFTTDILHNQQLFTPESNSQIQSINIKFEQFPIRRKKKVIEKDNNTLELINMKKSSQKTITCLSSSIDNEFNKSIENDKCLSVNNERKYSSPSQQKNNQSKCNLDTLKCTDNITESIYLNNSCRSPSKNISIETSPTNKTVLSSINNIEVKQVPITRTTNAIQRDNNNLNKSNKVAHSSCIKDNKNKYDSKMDSKKLSMDTLHNQKLCTYDNKKQTSSVNIEVEQVPFIRKTKVLENDNNTLNRFKKVTQESCVKDHKNKYSSKKNDKQLSTDILCNQKLSTCEKINQNKVPSINIEVEQFPIRRRKTVIEKDNNSIALSNVRKRSCVPYKTSSIDNEFHKSTENVKLLSMNNDREPLSPSQQKINQSTCNLDTVKCANSITKSEQLNNSCKKFSKNTSIETSPTNKTVIPSINIEVEQGSIFRHSNARKVIMRSTSDDKQETKNGRHVQLITIKDHYSKPMSSFNGAKKIEIDVSKKLFLTEKVVESSSHFYVPQVKKRRAMNFSSSDS
ncbi:uncharacterized protein MAL13P1.304-like [Metopolophium dirhodum]|uniref:uncharacterized protein MAL13P1.304-like n=1 Tax=Metopolophium dirhodum TaxID=44670 RepID=UPI00299029B0|nr:uncharacterized protein MAL13P1.304-like [Metopolophium dirhodum]